MRVLLVGSGGREHALAWKISQSPLLAELYAAPGNPGIARHATCLPVTDNDISELVRVSLEKQIDLVVIGSEGALALGLVDKLQEVGIAAFGPSQLAARIESSKAWAKAFMVRHQVPTAGYRCFTELGPALEYVRTQTFPQFIKASGLAAGKGAVLVESSAAAESVLEGMLNGGEFGEAGQEVVIEEFMAGVEISVFALTDGESMLVLPPAQDHKQVYDGDKGPNTGGMGAYAPTPFVTADLMEEIRQRILSPVLAGLRTEGYPYRGVLYAGLMLTAEGPKVVEFNARFGDPETQVLMPILPFDLLPVLKQCATGELAVHDIACSKHCATVIMAAPGYPGEYAKGLPVTGIQAAESLGCLVFQAGTSKQGEQLVSRGGRILAITGIAPTLEDALNLAYAGTKEVQIPGAHYRKDIGHRGKAHFN